VSFKNHKMSFFSLNLFLIFLSLFLVSLFVYAFKFFLFILFCPYFLIESLLLLFFLPFSYLSSPLLCLQSLCIHCCLQFLTIFEKFTATLFTLIYWAYLSYRHVVFKSLLLLFFLPFSYLSSPLLCLRSLCIHCCLQFLTIFEKFPATLFTLIYWAYLSYRHVVFKSRLLLFFLPSSYLSSRLICLQSQLFTVPSIFQRFSPINFTLTP
jgi:hypothetical protein